MFNYNIRYTMTVYGVSMVGYGVPHENNFCRQLSGNQYISDHLIFDGNVLVRNHFEPIRLNGMDPGKIISLDGNDTLIGKNSSTLNFLNIVIKKKNQN